jgi:hypothetical protein
LLYEGARKYFGGEIHSERSYVYNRFPFLDDDFVSWVFRSPFAGVYSNTLRPSPFVRFRSQYFYAGVMKNFKPDLLKYQTDHGFPPEYILSRFPFLKIGPSYLLRRWRLRTSGFEEFTPVKWMGIFLAQSGKERIFHSDITTNQLGDDYSSGNWRRNFSSFKKWVSFNFWNNA